jgi:hypothetical protein
MARSPLFAQTNASWEPQTRDTSPLEALHLYHQTLKAPHAGQPQARHYKLASGRPIISLSTDRRAELAESSTNMQFPPGGRPRKSHIRIYRTATPHKMVIRPSSSERIERGASLGYHSNAFCVNHLPFRRQATTRKNGRPSRRQAGFLPALARERMALAGTGRALATRLVGHRCVSGSPRPSRPRGHVLVSGVPRRYGNAFGGRRLDARRWVDNTTGKYEKKLACPGQRRYK